ncbi:MAG: class I SAM-dependent methyltransferase, partial [Deltaproteobacteria bacterium]|nr:class I SAM-dependent methyltransferase [Deltaproteobacteria bacterium]
LDSSIRKKWFPWIPEWAIRNYCSVEDLPIGYVVRLLVDGNEYFGYVDNSSERIKIKVFSSETSNLLEAFLIYFKRALLWRESRFGRLSVGRLFFSEADGFPGLTVDLYEDHPVLYVHSQGLRDQSSEFSHIVSSELGSKVIVKDAFDSTLREKSLKINFSENGIKYIGDVFQGHKTGFYLDQRINRKIFGELIKSDDTVLDLFCYSGGFGLNALKAGCKLCQFVDESNHGIEMLKSNLAINGFNNFKIERSDVFDFLANCEDQFDVIVCDPPAFTSSSKNIKSAEHGFKKLVDGCLRILRRNGLFVIFSCSWHFTIDRLRAVLLKVAESRDIKVQILGHLFQSPDHPYLLSFPPSLYLKGFICLKC